MRQRNLVPVVALALAVAMSACVDLKDLGGRAKSEASASNGVVESEATLDSATGTYSTSLAANSTETQVVKLGSGDLNGAQVSFPPGTLGVATGLAIGVGTSLAGGEVASALGLEANGMTAATKALSIEPTQAVDPVSPFSVTLPLGSASALALQAAFDEQRLAVVFKVKRFTLGDTQIGVIPPSELKIVDGAVSFDVSFFGSYQVVQTTVAVTARKEVAGPVATPTPTPAPAPTAVPTSTPVPAATPVAVVPPPDAPTAVTISGDETSATILWTAPAGATSFDLYWSTSTPVTTASGKVTGVTSPHQQTLSAGSRYFFRVVAVGAGGASALSDEVTHTPMSAWAKPGYGRNHVNWVPVSGATQYDLYWSTTSPVTTSDTKIANVTSTYLHSGLTNGVEVFYRVAAVAGGDILGVSAESAATPGGLAGPVCVDGQVLKVAAADALVYTGGAFARAGRCASGAAIVNSSGAYAVDFPSVDGVVYVIIPDGSGGWYVGGDFFSIGGQGRTNLAQVDASGAVVAGFDPDPDAAVHALAFTGSTLYVGGEFSIIDGAMRSFVAAVDVNGDALLAFNANADDTVRVLALDGANTWLYAAGDFAAMDATSLNGLAKLDATSGAADAAWDPAPTGTVYAMVVIGTKIYLGGSFTAIDASSRTHLAAVYSGGTLDGWAPSVDQSVLALAADGTTLYLGGNFTSAGGQTRNHAAAFDTGSGVVTSWDPDVDGTVKSVEVFGTTVYLGGAFTTVAALARNNAAAVGTNGAIAAFNPNAGRSSGEMVNRLVPSGSNIVLTGTFSMVGGLARHAAAALDEDGNLTPWDPDANASVRAFGFDRGSVYMSGAFTQVGGQGRTYLAKVDAEGAVTAWNPQADSHANAFIVSGTNVYVAGQFNNFGSASRERLAAFDRYTGALTSWAPTASGGDVLTMILVDSVLYVGGEFTHVNGQVRDRLASLDLGGNLSSTWTAAANGTVYALAAVGSDIFVGGNFSTVGGLSRANLAKVAANGSVDAAWNPGANAVVVDLAAVGSSVYAVGCFSTLGGQGRSYMGAVSASGAGAATAWDPGSGDNCASSVSSTSSTLYTGGIGFFVGGKSRAPAAIDASTGVLSW